MQYTSTVIEIIKKVFCFKHDFILKQQHVAFTHSGGVWSHQTYVCEKCGKIK